MTTRPHGRPRRGTEAATARLTIRLEPADLARLQAEAEAAGERPATTAHRGLLAWLYLYEATAAVAHMNTIVTTAVCSRWDESMICGQPSAWDPEPVYFVHKGHGHRHQE